MARCFMLVRGYGVVACPRRGHALHAQFSVNCYFRGMDAANAGCVVVGFGRIDGGVLIYVACTGAGGAVLSGSSGS